MYTIATHNQSFHADEIIAIALFTSLFDDDNYEIIRTRNEDILLDCDVVVDVGGEYFPAAEQFDHHQFKKDDPLYGKSSAGLIADHIGLTYEPFIDLVKAVDIRDTQGPHKCVKQYDDLFEDIRDCNLEDTSSPAQDKMFQALVNIFTRYFQEQIDFKAVCRFISAIAKDNQQEVRKIFSERKSTLIISHIEGHKVLHTPTFKYLPVKYLPTECETPLFITWDHTQKCWSLTCNTKCARIVNVDNAKFIHANGFITKITGTIDNLQGITGLQLAEA